MNNYPVFILAGGKGTRFPEETKFKPKPMIDILKKPMLIHIINHYKNFGFNNFHLLAGYKHEVITDFFNKNFTKNKKFKKSFTLQGDTNVNIINTGLNTMTGGRVLRGLDFISSDKFHVTYGDGLADVNIFKLNKFHLKNNSIATITAVMPPSKFGVLDLKYNNVKSFGEKIQASGSWINGGFMVFDKKIKEYLTNDSTILEKEPLSKLAQQNQLNAFKHYGFWQCVDTQREKEVLENYLRDRNK